MSGIVEGGAGQAIPRIAGGILGTLATLDAIRTPGGLYRTLAGRSEALSNPQIRSALVDSPFQQGFFFTGARPEVSPEAQRAGLSPDQARLFAQRGIQMLGPGESPETAPAAYRSVPNLPPLNPEAAARESLASIQTDFLANAPPEVRNQIVQRALNLGLTPEQAVADYTRAVELTRGMPVPPSIYVSPQGGVGVQRPSQLDAMIPWFANEQQRRLYGGGGGTAPLPPYAAREPFALNPNFTDLGEGATGPGEPVAPQGPGVTLPQVAPRPPAGAQQPGATFPQGFIPLDQLDPNMTLDQLQAIPGQPGGGAAYPSPAFLSPAGPGAPPPGPSAPAVPGTPRLAVPPVRPAPEPTPPARIGYPSSAFAEPPPPGTTVNTQISPTTRLKEAAPTKEQLDADFLNRLAENLGLGNYANAKNNPTYRAVLDSIAGESKAIINRYEPVVNEARGPVMIGANALGAIEQIKAKRAELGERDFYRLVGPWTNPVREFQETKLPEPVSRRFERVIDAFAGKTDRRDWLALRRQLAAIRAGAFALGGKALTSSELGIVDKFLPSLSDSSENFRLGLEEAERFLNNMVSWNIELSYLPAGQIKSILRERIYAQAAIAKTARPAPASGQVLSSEPLQ